MYKKVHPKIIYNEREKLFFSKECVDQWEHHLFGRSGVVSKEGAFDRAKE